MLFDLSSPGRKNVVRVVYGVLALLFAGRLHRLRHRRRARRRRHHRQHHGGGGGGDTAEQFEQQIEDAEEKLETDPNDQRALENLAHYRYLSGQVASSRSTRRPASRRRDRGVARRARGGDRRLVSRYLDTNPKKPDVAHRRPDRAGVRVPRRRRRRGRSAGDPGRGEPERRHLSTPRATTSTPTSTSRPATPRATRPIAEANPAIRSSRSRSSSSRSATGGRRAAEAAEKAPDPAHRRRPGLENPFGGLSSGGEAGCRPQPPSRPDLSLSCPPGPLAQLAEQETLNLKVEGSSPSWPT